MQYMVTITIIMVTITIIMVTIMMWSVHNMHQTRPLECNNQQLTTSIVQDVHHSLVGVQYNIGSHDFWVTRSKELIYKVNCEKLGFFLQVILC